jgi:hypothetical protein
MSDMSFTKGNVIKCSISIGSIGISCPTRVKNRDVNIDSISSVELEDKRSLYPPVVFIQFSNGIYWTYQGYDYNKAVNDFNRIKEAMSTSTN